MTIKARWLKRRRRKAAQARLDEIAERAARLNIALRRQVMQLQHFTDGNVPPGLLNAPDGWNAEQISQFQEWFDSVLAGNTGSRSRLVWGPSGAKYQAFKEAPYKDDFDEWLARIVCYAFSLPPTAFTRQVNRATAETSQEASLDEGQAPLMGWVKRLVDHVIQDVIGEPDLEFTWADQRPADPAAQAKILDTYVRDGIYAVNEARNLLGLDPVPGGDLPMIYGTPGAVPLGATTAPKNIQRASGCEHGPGCTCRGIGKPPLRKYNPDEPRVPGGSPQGGEWTSDGNGEFDVAASGGIPCDGFSAGCQSGGSYGSSAMFRIRGRNLCWDCAVKFLGLENEPRTVQWDVLEGYLIGPR